MPNTPIDLLCAGSSPRVDDGALDLGGLRLLLPTGFNPLHEGYDGTMLAVTDLLHAEQRRTGALSLYGMRGRIARELAARACADIIARGLEAHPDSWEAFFSGHVLDHMIKLWPEYAPEGARDAGDAPTKTRDTDNVFHLSEVRAAREASRSAAVATAPAFAPEAATKVASN